MAFAGDEDRLPIRWDDPGVPFLQFTHLELQLADGRALCLLSEIETGFYLVELDELPELRAFDQPASIFRERALTELPVGEIRIAQIRHAGAKPVAELRLLVSGEEIRLVAAEVREEHDGSLTIVELDESILIQVNGARPTPG